MLEKQFEELKLTGQLPSPTGVGLLILQTTQREDASLDDVVQILQADPTLTGRLLKLANSGNATGYESAGTAREAAVRLGLRTVRNVSLGFSLLAGHRTGICAGFDYEEYWSHSLATAAAAEHLAGGRTRVEASEAFTCALLSGIGRLALASIHPDAYEGVLERARGQSAQRLAEIESGVFGTNNLELASAMLRDWKLPERFAEAVMRIGAFARTADVRDPATRELINLLQDARDLARAMTLPVDATSTSCRMRLEELERLRERLGSDEAGMVAHWEAACEGWKAWGDLMRVRAQPALELPALRARAESGGTEDTPTASRACRSEQRKEGTTRGLRVLLVGLEEQTRSALTELLSRDGHDVDHATNGETGLGMALERGPHLVVTEWDMPGTGGLELVRTLRQSEIGKGMHLMMLTDQAHQPRVLEAFESGVDEHLSKPFEPRILQARVRAAERVVRLTGKVKALLKERENQLSQLAIQKRKLHMIAITDPLTGLFNRRYAMERLAKEVEVARSSNRDLAVVMIDIDHFKSVNDEHGHDTGDLVLSAAAKLLKGSVRNIDAPCRIGGEEFLILCPGASLNAARNVAERLRAASEENVIEKGSFHRAVTFSLGVATLQPDDADSDMLVKRADQCVYLAKARGRNRSVSEDELERQQRLVG